MPGDGYNSDDERGKKDTLWAQRCKLYTYRKKTKNWVQLGIGKGSLMRMTPTGRVEFVFEEESLGVPMAKHTVETTSGLQDNSGSTDKGLRFRIQGYSGWSWTAFDTIQLQDGEAEQWFTAKFSTMEVAQSFKDAFDTLKQNAGADVAPPGSPVLSPSSTRTLSKGRLSLAGSQPRSSPPSSPMLQSRHGPPSSQGSNPSSPKIQAEMTQSFGSNRSSNSPAQQSRQDSWLLYFERGMLNKRSHIRETSTTYIGVYSSKEKALVSSVRAMDAQCDKNQPWRSKACWDSVVDRRRTVGDRGVIISVEAEDGTFNHVKLRRLPFDTDLQASGFPEGDQLWESVD